MSTDRLQTLFLNIGHFFDHMLILIYATAVIAMGEEFGLSYAEMIAIATPGFVLYGAMSLPFGWLGDRKGRHGFMSLFFIGIGVATTLTALSTTLVELTIGLTAIGFFAAIYHPVGIPMLVQGVDKPGKKIGINGVWGNMGVAAAPLVVGALVVAYGWQAAFVVPGVVCICLGLIFWKFVPADTPVGPKDKKATNDQSEFQDGWRRVLLALGIITLIAGIIFSASTVALPKLFEERFGADMPNALGFAALASLVYALASFAQIASGFAVEKFSAKFLLIGILGTQVIVLPVVALADGPLLFAASLFLMAGVFGQIPIIDTVLTRYVPDSHRGRVFSVKYLLNLSVGAMAIPMIAGMHQWADGFTTLFQTLAIIAIFMVSAAFILRRPQPLAAE